MKKTNCKILIYVTILNLAISILFQLNQYYLSDLRNGFTVIELNINSYTLRKIQHIFKTRKNSW